MVGRRDTCPLPAEPLDSSPLLCYKQCLRMNLFTQRGDGMDQLPTPDNAPWPFPFPRQDWEQTPPAVQAYLRTVQPDLTPLQDLQDRVASLEARLRQDSSTSNRPPSSDHP